MLRTDAKPRLRRLNVKNHPIGEVCNIIKECIRRIMHGGLYVIGDDTIKMNLWRMLMVPTRDVWKLDRLCTMSCSNTWGRGSHTDLHMPLVKPSWILLRGLAQTRELQENHHSVDEVTWEQEDDLREDHPNLFASQSESRGRDSS